VKLGTFNDNQFRWLYHAPITAKQVAELVGKNCGIISRCDRCGAQFVGLGTDLQTIELALSTFRRRHSECLD